MSDKRVGQKIKLLSVDELLGVPNSEGCVDTEVSKIHPFKDHPFKVVDDDKMKELIGSISENGVLTPVIVRPVEGGDYEMISGHRRLYAAEKAGLDKLPAMIRDMTDDQAVITMVDANLQREEILPSEKAHAYKMRYEAMKRQGHRSDLTSSQSGKKSKADTSSQGGRKLWADEMLAAEVGESRNQIHRFLRLAELSPELLDLIDKSRDGAFEIDHQVRKFHERHHQAEKVHVGLVVAVREVPHRVIVRDENIDALENRAVLDNYIVGFADFEYVFEAFLKEVGFEVERPAGDVAVVVRKVGIVGHGFESGRPAVMLREHRSEGGFPAAHISGNPDVHTIS